MDLLALAAEPAALSLGQATPDAVVHRSLHRVGEALRTDRAVATDPLGFLVLYRAGCEPQIWVPAGTIS